MKKTMFACVAGVAILLWAAPGTLLAAAPTTPTKATGGVRFTWNGAQMAAAFNAHAGTCNRPAKGVLNLRQFGCTGVVKHYTIRVTKVVISGDTATFCGQVMAGSHPQECGRWVKVWVKDGGTPGRCGNMIGLKWATSQGAACNAPCPPLAPVTAGNLQVH